MLAADQHPEALIVAVGVAALLLVVAIGVAMDVFVGGAERPDDARLVHEPIGVDALSTSMRADLMAAHAEVIRRHGEQQTQAIRRRLEAQRVHQP